MPIKQLNQAFNKKRIRFSTNIERLKNIDIDIIHKTNRDNDVDTCYTSEPSKGSNGCLLFDQLQHWKELDISKTFRRFCYQISPFVQSLPELIHHQNTVVDKLIEQLKSVEVDGIESYVSLIAVLARDLQNDISIHFDKIITGLIELINRATAVANVNIELIGKIFKCFSYLLKYQNKSLIKNPSKLKKIYTKLLGHRLEYIRDFSAKAFSITIRKLNTNIFTKHIQSLINILSDKSKELNLKVLECTITFSTNKERFNDLPEQLVNTINGLSLLLFYSLKGLKGTLHSQGAVKLKCLLDLLLSTPATSINVESIFITGYILASVIPKLFYHIYPNNSICIWNELISFIEECNNLYNNKSNKHDIIYSISIDMIYYAINHTNNRALSDRNVKKNISKKLVNGCLGLIYNLLHDSSNVESKVIKRCHELFCIVWLNFPNHFNIISRLDEYIPIIIDYNYFSIFNGWYSGLIVVLDNLLPNLGNDLFRKHLLSPIIKGCVNMITQSSSSDVLSQKLMILCKVFVSLIDTRKRIDKYCVNIENNLSRELDRNNDEIWDYNDNDSSDDESNDSDHNRKKQSVILYSKTELDSYIEDFTIIYESCVEMLYSFYSDLNKSHSFNYESIYLSTNCLLWIEKFNNRFKNTDSTNDKMVHIYNCIIKLSNEDINTNSDNLFVITNTIELLYHYSIRTDSHTNIADSLIRKIIDIYLVSSLSIHFNENICNIIDSYHKAHQELYNRKNLLDVIIKDTNILNSFIDKITDGLLTPSYWIRLSLLNILSYDESALLIKTAGSNEEDSYVDIIQILLQATCVKIGLQTEREFTRMMSKLEILILNNRLTQKFIKIVFSTCIGMFNVKFKPFWAILTNVIAAGANNIICEDLVWPLLLSALSKFENIVIIKDNDNDLSPYRHLILKDNGNDSLEINDSISFLFPYVLNDNDLGQVYPDSRTDNESIYSSLWSILKKIPSITLRKSKSIVPMFFRFLSTEYYVMFSDDVNISIMSHLGVIVNDVQTKNISTNLTPKVIKKRLELYLSIFAEVTSPLQLYMNKLLFHIYINLLSLSDLDIVKYSFTCLLTYKPNYLTPYKQNLSNVLDDKLIRNELLSFMISDIVDISHREGLLAILLRILYGRLFSKKNNNKLSKDEVISRRNAILLYLTQFRNEEINTFIYLIYRSIIPTKHTILSSNTVDLNTVNILDSSFTEIYNNYYNLINDFVISLQPNDFSTIFSEKQIGFLFLLEQLIKINGLQLVDSLNYITSLLCNMLHNTITYRNKYKFMNKTSDGHIENDDDDVVVNTDDLIDNQRPSEEFLEIKSNYKNVLRISNMAILRLCELVQQFHSKFSFINIIKLILQPMTDLVDKLPTSLTNRKPPALLKLIQSLIMFDETISFLSDNNNVIEIIIDCLSMKSDSEILKVLYHIFIRLIDFNNGQYIRNYVDSFIMSFAKRFQLNITEHTNEIKLSELSINSSGSIKLELSLLYYLSSNVLFRDDIDIQSTTISNLSSLLLGLLRTYSMSKKFRIDEEWILQILSIYKTIIHRIIDVNVHIPFLSRLFGPSHQTIDIFNHPNIRNLLVDIFIDLSNHSSCQSCVKNSAVALSHLVAIDKNLLDTRDYDKCMLVFQDLSDINVIELSMQRFHWNNLLGRDICPTSRDTSLCLVIIYECIRCMYDKELIIRNSALVALKCLIDCVVKWCNITLDNYDINLDNNLDKISIIITIIIPAINIGLKQSSDLVIKGFIMLLSHVIQRIGLTPYGQQDENKKIFYSDLIFLLHDDPEQDFFENIVHIQIHRRNRALMKLKILILESVTSINTRSLIHILIPLSLYPIMSNEYVRKDHQYMLESSNLLGVLAYHLPWSHYFKLIKNILKKLDKNNPDKEKALIATLSNILDSFHFDMTAFTDSDIIDYEIENSVTYNIDDHVNQPEEPDKILNDEHNNSVIPSDCKSKNIPLIMYSTIYPWVKSYLLKDELDQHGNKTKVIRTQVAVALIKIINQFQPPLVTLEKKQGMYLNIVISVINTLKSRDVSVRDVARDSLNKIVLTMGLSILQSILYELQFILKEGYQRHICSYTIRNLLSIVLKDYIPPLDAITLLNKVNESIGEETVIVNPEFDLCIPLLMDVVIDDIVGLTQIDRDVDSANRTLIREAKGIKCYDILELMGKNILFRPTYVLKDLKNPTKVSSIHAVSTPLLELCIQCNDRKDVLNRVWESLNRLSNGLVNNQSVIPEELLLYIQSTIEPFIALAIKEYDQHKLSLGKLRHNYKISDGLNNDNDEMNEEYNALPSYLRDESSDEEDLVVYTNSFTKRQKVDKDNDVIGYKPSTWLPNDNSSIINQREVIKQRELDRKALITVQDGMSAPKLTGNNRYDNNYKKSKVGSYKSNEGTIHAMNFCLTLLLSSLKKNSFDVINQKTKSMLQSLSILLGHCLRLSNATSMICLTIRCLTILLSYDLSIDQTVTQVIGSRLLKLMFKGGIVITSDNEIVQVCIKGLITLFKYYNQLKTNNANKGTKLLLPIPESKIRLLLQLLTNSIMEITSNYQNTAFLLIKSIIETHLLFPEIYDLINKLFDQLVISQRSTVRESSSSIIIEFILHYPLSSKRFNEHLKQLIVNCSYEFEDGRHSALSTLLYLIKVIPRPVLHENVDIIFLSLAVRIGNDSSTKCMDVINNIFIQLFKRLDVENCNKLIDYCMRWIDIDIFQYTNESKGLFRTGIQILSQITKSKSDLLKKSKHFNSLLLFIHQNFLILLISTKEISWIHKQSNIPNDNEILIQNNEGDSVYIDNQTWYLIYHILIFIENLYTHLSSFIEQSIYNIPIISIDISNKIYDLYGIVLPTQADTNSSRLFDLIQETLLYPHVWIRSVSSRILSLYISSRNCNDIASTSIYKHNDYLLYPNALFQLARRVCIVINQPYVTDNLFESSKKILVFVIRAMYYHPHLCSSDLINKKELNDEMNNQTEALNNYDDTDSINSNDDGKSNDEKDNAEIIDKDKQIVSGANWVMQRLKNIGSDRRGMRRFYAVKIFTELIEYEDNEIITKHINQILEIAIRIEQTATGPDMNNLQLIKQAAIELTNSLENKLGSHEYMTYYTTSQKRIQSNRLNKKHRYAIEAVTNPNAFASNKTNKRKSKDKHSNKQKSLKDLAIRIVDDEISMKRNKRVKKSNKVYDYNIM